MLGRFMHRTEAGQELAEALDSFAGRDDVIVLALPRGGLPVAVEVSRRLNAPLDVMVVRKLGVPGHEELAMGAIASGGVRVLDRMAVDRLNIDSQQIEAVVDREQRELKRREQLYRGDRPYPDLEGRCVILVDDGLATGSTMRAAVRALIRMRTGRIVVAVPVAPPEARRMLAAEADEVVCLHTPDNFHAVGQWYEHFDQVTDEQVQRILRGESTSHATH